MFPSRRAVSFSSQGKSGSGGAVQNRSFARFQPAAGLFSDNHPNTPRGNNENTISSCPSSVVICQDFSNIL